MPAADTVLLPLAVGLTLLGLLITLIAWRRGARGRVIQGLGLALLPVALYFSGLLRLVWNGVVAIGSWATKIIFSPAVWLGLSMLGLCLVLWVVGGVVARRAPSRRERKAAAASSSQAALPQSGANPGGKTGGRTSAKPGARTQPPIDDDMAEIEALLKSRGIE